MTKNIHSEFVYWFVNSTGSYEFFREGLITKDQYKIIHGLDIKKEVYIGEIAKADIYCDLSEITFINEKKFVDAYIKINKIRQKEDDDLLEMLDLDEYSQ